jgi:DivIVA domain-containing protein
MRVVTPSFPRVKGRAVGYSVPEVDEFIRQARTAFNTEYARAVQITSEDVRTASFKAEAGGYSPREVDAALERLETAFAERERAVGIAAQGEGGWIRQANYEAAILTARFARKPKQRFNRASLFERGYSVKDVDSYSKKVLAYLESGSTLTVSDVRSVAFRGQLGGYDEAQVDAVLDATVALLLARGQS